MYCKSDIGHCCYIIHQMAALCYDPVLMADDNVILIHTTWLKRGVLVDYSTYCLSHQDIKNGLNCEITFNIVLLSRYFNNMDILTRKKDLKMRFFIKAFRTVVILLFTRWQLCVTIPIVCRRKSYIDSHNLVKTWCFNTCTTYSLLHRSGHLKQFELLIKI